MRFKLGCFTAALLLLATVAVAATYEETIAAVQERRPERGLLP